MASVESTQPTTGSSNQPTFTVFAKLPNEVKMLVWENFRPIQRVISVLQNGVEVYGEQSMELNPLLSVCRLSRKVTLKRLILWNRYDWSHGMPSATIPFYVDPEWDISDFSSFSRRLRTSILPMLANPMVDPPGQPLPMSALLASAKRVSFSFDLPWSELLARVSGSLSDPKERKTCITRVMNRIGAQFPQAQRITILSKADAPWPANHDGKDMSHLLLELHGLTDESMTAGVKIGTKPKSNKITHVKDMTRGVFFVQSYLRGTGEWEMGLKQDSDEWPVDNGEEEDEDQ